MRYMLRWALLALAFVTCAPAAAQHATSSAAPAGYAPEYRPITVKADSTPATGSVTSSAVTPTGSTATFASGTATIRFTPSLGYPVRLLLKGGATFTASVGTSVDGCATVNTLTAGGAPITYSGSVNEYVDVPVTTETSLSYCLVIAVTGSGTESYAMRN